MKIKNLNPIELHIEKIVLAVAVLGAGYLAYSCWSNPTMIAIPGVPEPKTPNKVEETIQEQIATFRERQGDTKTFIKNNKLVSDVNRTEFESRYKVASSGSLPNSVINASPAVFGPSSIAAGATEGVIKLAGPQIESLVLPDFKAAPTAEVFQGVVGNWGGAAGGGGGLLNQRDAHVVKVTALYPMAALRSAMSKYRSNYQVVLVTNATWERQERTPNGWSEWKPVSSVAAVLAPGATAPATAPANLSVDAIVRGFRNLHAGAGEGQAQSFLKQLKQRMPENLQPKLPVGYERDPKDGPMFAAPVVVGGGGALTRPADGSAAADEYGGTVGENDAAPNASGGAGAEWAALTAKDNIEIFTYDTSLEAGHEYRYRVSVAIYNPLYMWPTMNKDLLKDPKTLERPFFFTEPTEPTALVKVDPLDYFFVTNGGGLAGSSGKKDTVRVEIFKKKLGVWYKAIQDEVPVGGQIGVGSLSIFDKTPEAPKDFSTKFSIVDVIPDNSGAASGVVLTNALDQLVSRSVTEDKTNSTYKELEKVYSRGTRAAAAGSVGPAGPGLP